MSTNQLAIVTSTEEARTTHDTGYQVIDGVTITPKLLERSQILQTNCNEGIRDFLFKQIGKGGRK